MKESQEEKDKKKKKKRLKGTVLASTAAAGVLVNGLFGTPADLVADHTEPPKPSVIVMMENDTPIDEESSEDEESSKKKKTLKEILAGWVLRLPQPVRILIGLPLWVIGWAVSTLIGLAWTHLLSPIWGNVSAWLISALLLFGIFVVTLKSAFPQIPLKKLLSPKNAGTCLISVLILGAIVNISVVIWPELSRFERLAHFVSGLLALGATLLRFRFKEGKKLFAAPTVAMPAPEGPKVFETAEEFWADRDRADRSGN